MEGGARGPETSKTKPTCSITAWARGWGGELEEPEEGSPTQEVEEEVAGGGEEAGPHSPQVR